MTHEEAREIMEKLKVAHPNAKAELNANNPFELLIAVILSAQTTDVRVNQVTPILFAAYPDPAALSKAPLEHLEEILRPIGFFRTKAQNIKKTAQRLCGAYGGQVPESREELMTLPGVGRKTANVVLSNAFGVPALAVDTHVFRVSHRLGLSDAETVDETERDLNALLDRSLWSEAHHLLIFQGRYVCKARKPLCEECAVREHCRYLKGRS
ncbi:MAG: endonuclease III [Peptoniphilaceae bacterium]|nr:endonuclease III [Peptoniphilaceae bacterium]MDY6086299.1 endonuclease III [Peptoniphilaceae bacterium]